MWRLMPAPPLPLDVVAAWASDVTRSWLWDLPPVQLRVALFLIARSQPHGVDRMTSTTDDQIAVTCRMSRGAVRRALATLERGGFCQAEAMRGPGGRTMIRVLTRELSSNISPDHLDVLEISIEAADLVGCRDHLQPFHTDHLENLEPPVSASVSMVGISRPDHLADPSADTPRVRDLTGSRVSDLRSSETGVGRSRGSRDLKKVCPGLQTALPGVVDDPDFSASPDSLPEPAEADPEVVEKKIRADKIPERAFKAADYLRGFVLRGNPAADVGRRPWDVEKKAGVRLVWANDLRMLAEPRPVGRDGRGWSEVAAVIKWVFEEQDMFVVESAEALRRKWGSIQGARARAAKPRKPSQQAVPRRTFQAWDADWDKEGKRG